MCSDSHERPDAETVLPSALRDRDQGETIPLMPVEAVTLTTLVDNSTDLLLADQGPVKRAGLLAAAGARRLPTSVIEGGEARRLRPVPRQGALRQHT